jgi:CHASE2 domain-containing sensor protein
MASLAKPTPRRARLLFVADLQKRGSYTPRRAREQRAYRLVVTGGVAGVVGVVGLVLAIAGVIGATLPVIALIIAAICVVLFRQATSTR